MIAATPLSVGDELRPVSDLITYRRAIMNSATTLDYFPGHFDPEYAREVGHPTIFVNTMHLMGFIDRLTMGWCGPTSFIMRRTMKMSVPIYAGDTMVGSGIVTAVTAVGSGAADGPRVPEGLPADLTTVVELTVRLDNQHGVMCAQAQLVVAIAPTSPTPRS